MEKVNVTKVEVEKTTREIYCNLCEKHLGTFVEYENGYMKVLKPLPPNSRYSKGVRLNKKQIRLKGILCEECRKKVDEKIRDAFWSIATQCRLGCEDEYWEQLGGNGNGKK